MKKLIIILGILGLGAGLSGQNLYTDVTYNVAFPTGKTAEFINGGSGRGFGVESGKFISENISLGISLQWQAFYKRELSNTYTEYEPVRITGVAYKYENVLPIMITGKYYFWNEDKIIMPYLGLSAGAMYHMRRITIGLYDIEEKAFQPTFMPELGIIMPGNKEYNFFANVRYYHSIGNDKLDGASYVGISAGLMIHY